MVQYFMEAMVLRIKKLAAIAAVIVIIFACITVCGCSNRKNTDPLDSAVNYLIKNIDMLTVGSAGGDWTAMILAEIESHNELVNVYRENARLYISEKGGVLHNTRCTEYSRVVLALDAVGENPRDIGGYNIVTPLLNFEAATKQGVNGAAWALIALDAVDDNSGDIAAVREDYISYILSAQNDDGSIGGLVGSEVDMTAMCLRALAPYTERADIASVCDSGVKFIAERQGASGGFPSLYGESSETVSQVLLAFDALGVPLDDSRLNAGVSLIDVLLSYQNRDGGFSHNIDGESNLIATEQAVLALLEYEALSEVTE